MGLIAVGEGVCGSQSWGYEGGRGYRQFFLSIGFFGGGVQVGVFFQRVFVVVGIVSVSVVFVTDVVDFRDVVVVVGYVVVVDRVGSEVIVIVVVGVVDDGCRGRVGQYFSGRVGVELRGSYFFQDRWGCFWRDALCGGFGYSCFFSRGKCFRDSFFYVLFLVCLVYS